MYCYRDVFCCSSDTEILQLLWFSDIKSRQIKRLKNTRQNLKSIRLNYMYVLGPTAIAMQQKKTKKGELAEILVDLEDGTYVITCVHVLS